MKNSIEKMKTKFPNCCDTKRNKVAQENGKKFEIKCSETYYLKVRIDDCLISCKQVNKCDYLFIRDYECLQGETEFYFVELKGSDIKKAFEQIKNTISYIKSNHISSLSKNKILGFIVSSKVPRGGVDVTKMKLEFSKKYGREPLKIQCKKIIHTP